MALDFWTDIIIITKTDESDESFTYYIDESNTIIMDHEGKQIIAQYDANSDTITMDGLVFTRTY